MEIVEFYLDKSKGDRISKLNRSKSGARDDSLQQRSFDIFDNVKTEQVQSYDTNPNRNTKFSMMAERTK